MPKSNLLIQLIYNGRAIWQVKQDVPSEICRRMTGDELKALGEAAAYSLDTIAREANPLSGSTSVARPVSVAKKKR